MSARVGYSLDMRVGSVRNNALTRSKSAGATVGVELSHLKLPDLYYLKSTCEDAERRGKPFSVIFWWSIKPKED